jgi:3-hydroxyacyl-[acyl-carrier-protein] dehydratase
VTSSAAPTTPAAAWQPLDLPAVHGLLPHRPPFLFVDRAEIDVANGQSRAWHLFLAEEPYFEGHFPGAPIVPGVVLLECMAQAGRLLLNAQAGGIQTGFLVGVDSAKFNQTVHPGDLLRIEARLVRDTGDLATGAFQSAIHSFKCAAYLGSSRCARAQINLYQARGATTAATPAPAGAGHPLPLASL